MRKYIAAERPTMYFIGVTTAKSSIMKVFPKWAEFLRLNDVEIRGIDFKVHDDPKDTGRLLTLSSMIRIRWGHW